MKIEKMKAVILAAGAGRRMKVSNVPKALIPINGKPMICNVIDALIECGIRNILVVKYYADSFNVLDAIYANAKVSIEYIDDYERKGSLFSFSLVRKYVKREFICLDCDLHVDVKSFSKMLATGLEKIDKKDTLGVMAYVKKPSRIDSDMLLIENEYVVRFLKNGNLFYRRGGYVYIWKKNIFDDIAVFFEQRCYSLSIYYDYIVQNYLVGVMEIEDIWDIDNEDDVKYTNAIMKIGDRVE